MSKPLDDLKMAKNLSFIFKKNEFSLIAEVLIIKSSLNGKYFNSSKSSF